MSRPLTTLAAMMAGLVLLTGCSEAGEQAAEQTAEERIEEAAEGQGEDVDVDIDDDEVTIESSDGSVTMGGGKLPDGFPKDDIPLVEGEVLTAMGVEGEGWQVNVQADGDPEQAFDEAVRLLTEAGFAADENGSAAGMMTASLTGRGYTVAVLANGAADVTTISYVVEVD